MPTNRHPATRDEREAARKAAELEKRRSAEAKRLADHNRLVAASVQRTRPGRIVSKPRPLPVTPVDLEAGRYRRARDIPGFVRTPSHAMPNGVADRFGPTLNCDHCGYPMLSYVGRGAYYCSARRLTQSKYQTSGCGRYSYGPTNETETPYTDAERERLNDPELLPL